MPAHFREEVDGFEKPTLGRMLAEFDQRMMPFQTQSAARAEIKNLMQEEGDPWVKLQIQTWELKAETR